MANAVILLSGGLDSATALAIARHEGYACYALSVRYGQRHAIELDAARRVAESLGVVQHQVFDIDLSVFGRSALTDENIPVPESETQGIPVTYVPARNTVFLALALGWAEVLQANDIFIGVNAIDYSGYPDCRPEYIQAFQTMASLATKAAVEGQSMHMRTPLIHMTKAQIIQKGIELDVDYALTVSCYKPDQQGRACGVCDACRLRAKGFDEAGVEDPTVYQTDTQA